MPVQASKREEEDELEAILEVLRRKQREKLARDRDERARMEARMREDMEALRREWESAIDRQIDAERTAYEVLLPRAWVPPALHCALGW